MSGRATNFKWKRITLARPHTHLSLTRVYNSLDSSSTPFGIGWHSPWHRSINVPAPGTALVTREDGRVDTFTQNSSGSWTSDPDVTSVLTQVTDGNGNAEGWQLTRADDSIEALYSERPIVVGNDTGRPGHFANLRQQQ